MLRRKQNVEEYLSFSEKVKHKLDVMRKYDTTFSSYDKLHREEQYGKYMTVLSIVKMAFKGKTTVLDLGCGTSLLYEFALKMLDENCLTYYVGLDLSINMLKIAKRKIKRNTVILSDLLQGDAEFLPFRNKCFDFILSFTTFQNVPDVELAILEVKRTLRSKSSIAVISVPKKVNININVKGKEVFEEKYDIIYVI